MRAVNACQYLNFRPVLLRVLRFLSVKYPVPERSSRLLLLPSFDSVVWQQGRSSEAWHNEQPRWCSPPVEHGEMFPLETRVASTGASARAKEGETGASCTNLGEVHCVGWGGHPVSYTHLTLPTKA